MESRRLYQKYLQFILYTTAEKKILENLLPVGLLVHTNLSFRAVFGLTLRNLTLAGCAI